MPSIAISLSVCLFVGLSVCRSRVLKTPLQINFTKISVHIISMAVARSSSADNAIRYVLPVLWMTSCFHIMGPNRPESKTTRMFLLVRQVAVPATKSAVSDCTLFAFCCFPDIFLSVFRSVDETFQCTSLDILVVVTMFAVQSVRWTRSRDLDCNGRLAVGRPHNE